MGYCEMRTVDAGFRRALCASLALLAWLGLANDAVNADEVTRVFLFAGQSNMVGSDAHADPFQGSAERKGFYPGSLPAAATLGFDVQCRWPCWIVPPIRLSDRTSGETQAWSPC
ncbi:MAG: hypothetical protein JSS02_09335 [Planctomycetes bacterium]|nr:hypothetical protein [Planctomycetota bacterium]